MKMQRRGEPFIRQLKKVVDELKKMKPGEVHVLNVHASYGHYQIVIGPEALPHKRDEASSRPIEINGEVHHLFISPHAVRAFPSKKQMLANMKDTVIMRELCIHMKDPKGDGNHLEAQEGDDNRIRVRECINLAGDKGEEMIEKAASSKNISMATYRIVQQDIIKALKERKKYLRE